MLITTGVILSNCMSGEDSPPECDTHIKKHNIIHILHVIQQHKAYHYALHMWKPKLIVDCICGLYSSKMTYTVTSHDPGQVYNDLVCKLLKVKSRQLGCLEFIKNCIQGFVAELRNI